MSAKAIFFLDENATYSGPEPYFYDKEHYAWAEVLEKNWTMIRDEMLPIINGEEEIALSSPYPPLLSEPGAWKNIYFFNFMWQYHSNCNKYPRTYTLLKSIPNLTFAEFTVLEPGCKVLPHIGETNTTIRGHLGISIPGKLPEAGIRVGNEERSWEEGKVVLFSDCHRHTVWNNTSGRRFVLVFDITRDEFIDKKYWVNAQSLSALTIKFFDQKFNFSKHIPKWCLTAIHKAIAVLWLVYLPFQNAWRFIYSR
jgi:aspartyl/asparaginyl beta-hydroxylase (cupin superfamily)